MAFKILVADDHPAIALAIRNVLECEIGWEVCDDVTTVDDLVRGIATFQPNVVVTDYHMPGSVTKDGLRMLNSLRRCEPTPAIVVFTMMTNAMILRAMVDLPVQGLLLKDSPLDELVKALRRVQRGLRYIGKSAAAVLAQARAFYPYSDDGRAKRPLSVRETEVLRLYLTGKSVTQIAGVLSRSVKTISRQKNCAMQKLGATNDRELFDFAARQDLVLPANNR